MKKLIVLLSCGFLLLLASFRPSGQAKLYPALSSYLQTIEKDFARIPEERKSQLKKMALYIKTKLNAEKKANLVFICTHNSRRSHMSQLWALAAASYYNVNGIAAFSGGTEATAFNERAIRAMVKAGFVITKKSGETNPVYEAKFGENATPVFAFSKKYMDSPNPTSNFAAIMTCSHADKNCPIVQGASIKLAIPYEDPKAADGQPNEAQVYNERSKQIATEMLYVFSLVKAVK